MLFYILCFFVGIISINAIAFVLSLIYLPISLKILSAVVDENTKSSFIFCFHFIQEIMFSFIFYSALYLLSKLMASPINFIAVLLFFTPYILNNFVRFNQVPSVARLASFLASFTPIFIFLLNYETPSAWDSLN